MKDFNNLNLINTSVHPYRLHDINKWRYSPQRNQKSQKYPAKSRILNLPCVTTFQTSEKEMDRLTTYLQTLALDCIPHILN